MCYDTNYANRKKKEEGFAVKYGKLEKTMKIRLLLSLMRITVKTIALSLLR